MRTLAWLGFWLNAAVVFFADFGSSAQGIGVIGALWALAWFVSDLQTRLDAIEKGGR